MEQISGPVNGYYIAAWAKPVGLGRFIGRATICTEKVRSARGALGVQEVSSRGIYNTALKAIQAAEFQARGVCERLPQNWSPFTRPGDLTSR